jgi:hypothetical protein
MDDVFIYLRASRIVLPRGADLAATRARAIPSFSRQTKLACAVCHYGFPQLTPFGRMFKLNGYTLTGLPTIAGGDTSHPTLKLAPIPPASAMLIVSMTNTRAAQPGTQNNSTAFPDALSLFVAGEITPKLGGFAQVTYTGQSGSIGIDNTELRFADRTTLGKKPLTYGVTLHNNPTVQDLWNTTPAWGFPFVSSAIAPSPIASPIINGALAQQVLGLGAYGMWNDLLYTEFTAYRSAPQGIRQPLDSSARNVTHHIVPYWRVALQHGFGANYLMVGTYGMIADMYPAGVSGPTDHFTDIGADAQFEHPVKTGVFIARTTYQHERQRLDALVATSPPGASTAANDLNTFRLNASYLHKTRVELTLGYFRTTGSTDPLLYTPGSVTGSRTGSPDTDGGIAEVDFNPWQNTRLGAQYVLYSRFNGASTSYDGTGRSASGNNTLYLFAWLAF